MNFTIEQSESEIYTPTAGLSFVGHALDRKKTLRKTLSKVVRRHGIPNIDLVRVYAGILATGKSDFDAVENVRDDDFFRLSMGIGQMPSSSRLRQRFDEDAAALTPLIDDSLAEIVANMEVSVTPLPKRLDKHRHVPLDIDVFPMDNSAQRKKVSPTPTKVMMVMRQLQPGLDKKAGALAANFAQDPSTHKRLDSSNKRN